MELRKNEFGNLPKIETGQIAENITEKPREISHEEIIEGLDSTIGKNEQMQEDIAQSIDGTNEKLAALREKLGIPHQREDVSSVSIEKEILDKKALENELLEKEKTERIFQQERQKLIKEEKRRILQEKINGLFEEFSKLNSQELQNILASGQPIPGRNMQSEHMGELSRENAQSFASAFAQGIKMLPEILRHVPKLLEELDKELSSEAEKNVDEAIEKQKAETEIVDETEKDNEIKNSNQQNQPLNSNIPQS